jgi:uncharacterized protein (DUF433 family)
MAWTIEPQKVPLEFDGEGVCRVAGTRVPLETILAAFEDGATAEEIADRYPAVAVADIYTVIGYYLRHREPIDAYLEQAQRQQAEMIREIDRQFPKALRERWLARRKPVVS